MLTQNSYVYLRTFFPKLVVDEINKYVFPKYPFTEKDLQENAKNLKEVIFLHHMRDIGHIEYMDEFRYACRVNSNNMKVFLGLGKSVTGTISTRAIDRYLYYKLYDSYVYQEFCDSEVM